MKCLTVDKQSLHTYDSKCKQEECPKFQITHCIPGQLCSMPLSSHYLCLGKQKSFKANVQCPKPSRFDRDDMRGRATILFLSLDYFIDSFT